MFLEVEHFYLLKITKTGGGKEGRNDRFFVDLVGLRVSYLGTLYYFFILVILCSIIIEISIKIKIDENKHFPILVFRE